MDKRDNKILIVNLLYLGDLLFAFPFLRNLRKNLPDSRIDMIVNSSFYEIIKNNQSLDGVYPFDKKMGIKNMIKFARPFRSRGYDVGINIHGSFRSLILMSLTKPKKKIGFAEKGGAFFLDRKITPQGEHMVEVYLNFLKALNLPVLDPGKLDLTIPQETREEIKPMLLNWGIKEGEKLIGINTGGTWPTKRWTSDGFADLADTLISKGFRVVFTGGVEDKKRVQEVLGKMKKSGAIVAAGETSLLQLAALLEKCSMVISGDTGPVHVAAAVGTPTITLFGPSNEKKYRPWGQGHIVIKTGIDCRPCGKHECPDIRCMRGITPEKIIGEIDNYFS